MAEPSVVERASVRRLDAPRSFAGLSAILGASVLVGWALGIDSLTRVLPGLATMKPNTALAFLMAGVALWSIRDGRPAGRWAVGLSLAVAAIGGLTLFEYASGVHLGIDQILAHEPPNGVGSLSAGRMHPATAFDFLALGLALALIAVDRGCRTAHGLVLLAALIAGSTLIGYLYGVRVFAGLAAYHQMALHTTLGMLFLSAGALLARPGRGLMVAITGDGPSGLMARGLLPVAVLAPVIINGLMLLAREAGLFDERYGTAVRVSLIIAIFVACIGRGAHVLNRIDLDRRRAEAERIETEERFRFLAEAMPQIVWISRPDGEVKYLNRRWFDYTGQDPRGAWDWRPVIHPDELARCLELWDRSALSGENYQGEFRFRRHDGAYRWHLARAEPMRDDRGRIVQWVGTSTDIDDQKRAGEQRYRSLVEATSAIVWSTSASGEVEGDLPAWTSFTGQPFERSKGRGWLEAIHPDDRGESARAWSEALASRRPCEMEHRLRRHDGEYRHMQVRAVPLFDRDGALLEWVGTSTDVDDQERAHEAMREAKEAAEAATRAKGEFLANMSHEIRTPMNGVLGMTELALETDLTTLQREYLEVVKSSADALLTIIDDILDFSKIDAGKLHLDLVPFRLRDTVTDTLRAVAMKAHEKGLELACRIGPEVPETVVGDPGRLRQVLLNLVGNAIKFTDRGEVVLTVEAGLAEDGPDDFRFGVADTGIGIPAGKRASIFNAFEQADGSTTRKYGGTGLGLTICSRLVGLMHGRIWVEENPGGGSLFRFTARLGRDVEARADRDAANPVVLDGLRVLIVDDNRTNRAILDEVLSQWGCRPLAVASGPDALDALDRAAGRGEPFPLVLLDRMMPGMDGCDLARRVQADPRHASTRMLMLTSGGSDDSGRFRELGIDAWLAKPIRQSDLLNAMLDLLRPDRDRDRDRPAPIQALPVEARRPLRVLLAEDHPINQKVATRMLEDRGHEVTVVDNGRLALEALESGAFDLVLMDVQMPEMGGFEALEGIRTGERSRGGHLPIVALTAHAMAGDRERCLEAGFDDYLAKPIHATALAEALARVMGDDQGAPTADGPKKPEVRRDFDREASLKALNGDDRLLDEILGLYLDDGPRLLAEVGEAVDRGDAGALKRLGHTLAGSAGHFAADGVVDAARRLEAIGKAGDLSGADQALRSFALEFDRFRQAATDALRPEHEALGA